ncbi:hypothetical protein JR316_0010859 [Psilocybe cubensis]|uniref:Uncharacterized protein n=2 Tax=Psilocybe cubensis TaxID=181762 RepID=A0ACB8GMK6_PSICU|nr:hypothetical protein JR316_0010859 [Psilocybe cubensis]KAH9476943.1 hypothetical protein JR316_0010859 [Psilocybe cubensis]
MSPRPILKRALSTEQHSQQFLHHHHRHIHHPHTTPSVHFPPSPSLTRTFSVYSAAAYDRSPIVVSPNTCALPERGCPGRTYLLDEQATPSRAPRSRGIAYARDYHPRALAFASASSSTSSASRDYAQVPQLVPDISSESEESDGFYSMPLPPTSQQTFGIHGLAGPNGNGTHASVKYHSNSSTNHHYISINKRSDSIAIASGEYTPCNDAHDSDPLAFLPYGPASPSSPHHFAAEHDEKAYKPRRKRTDRRHESSADPDRIPRGHVAGERESLSLGIASLSVSPSQSAPVKRKKGVRRSVPVQQSFGTGAFCSSDDGCLGGF